MKKTLQRKIHFETMAIPIQNLFPQSEKDILLIKQSSLLVVQSSLFFCYHGNRFVKVQVIFVLIEIPITQLSSSSISVLFKNVFG